MSELTTVLIANGTIAIIGTVPIGPQGPPGPDGVAGEGVPAGGTTDQVLAKASDTDFDTEWVDPTGGGGGGGAPTDAGYLVTTANGFLSAEVVVGATPGGELGGTWASPTVDATHAGSTHAAVQAAAEATAAADATAKVAAEATLARNADNLTAGTVADARVASTIARDSEVTAAVAAEATLARNADNLTSGTVADARIASTIARDSEVTSAISTSEAGQVRDGDTAGGVLAGTYPSPSFAADMATQAELDALPELAAANSAEVDLTTAAGVTTLTLLGPIARRDLTINTQTGTGYTLALTDNRALIRLTNASGVILTMPQDSAVALPVGAHGWYTSTTVTATTAAGTGATASGTGAFGNGQCLPNQIGVWVKTAANTFVTYSGGGSAAAALALHTVAADPHSAYALESMFHGKVVGQYYVMPGTVSAGAAAPSLSRMLLMPKIMAAGTLDRIGVEVVTGEATGVTRLGVYSSLANSYPNSLIAEATTTIDNTTPAVHELTISAVLPTTGLYWLALVVQTASSAVRFRSITSGYDYPMPIGTAAPAASSSTYAVRHVSSTTGALPAGPLSSPSSGDTIAAPRMFYRYSA